MNEEIPTRDPAQCALFMSFWCKVTGTQHITLVAIAPDGPATTTTFTVGELDQADAWIDHAQTAKRNVYFQVNETPVGCAAKPKKGMMIASLCRHADVDPVDDRYPYAEERDRLHRLAKFLCADPVMPPTVILDSGNGIQPLWVVVREPLTPEIIKRVECENREIEVAVGAARTHNIDRLLRLPGTLNYPNTKKLKLGRGVTYARVLHSASVSYSTVEAARLSKHLAQRLSKTGLVRPSPTGTQTGIKSAKAAKQHLGPDRSRIALRKGAAVRRAGKSYEEMCAALRSDPETADWCKEKGERNNERELRRIWERGAAADTVAAVLTEFNARFMVVREAGKAVIYASAYDGKLKRHYYDRLSFGDLRQLYLNRTVVVRTDNNQDPVRKPAAEVWLHHRGRRQFIGGVTFDPSGHPVPPDVLNLWRGFGVEPRPGRWDLMQSHIKDVICSSNQDHFDYLMGLVCEHGATPCRTRRGCRGLVRRRGHRQGYSRAAYDPHPRPACARYLELKAPDRKLQCAPARLRVPLRR